jgi:uncharacterized protein
MDCRIGCGACCVVPSISSRIPGMPGGKPAFTPCVNFNPETGTCGIWSSPEYPAVCRDFTPTREFCGSTSKEAYGLLAEAEDATSPDSD